jgi:tRNA pseudouridine38-40 synthase
MGPGIRVFEVRVRRRRLTEAGLDRNHRMELQYDGSGLHGWARQEGLPTVEGCLEAALATVLGHAPALRVAGRTDAGVHARRQVASLHLPAGTDPVRMMRSLNALTPPGIAVTDITRAPAAFDARKDAVSRTYRYFLTNDEVVAPFWTPYCWHVIGELDVVGLRAAAELVTGRHDFTAFTPTETEHVFFDRLVLRCAWRKSSGGRLSTPTGGRSAARGGARGLLCMEIEAEAFLRHMVRTLVGTMLEVARGARTLDDLGRLLRGAPRQEAGPTAPAHGLFLWDVRYRKPSRV